jgi:hypothetical protein
MKQVFTFLMLLMTLSTFAQSVVDFEDIDLPADSFLNGENGEGQFESGVCTFPNSFLVDPDFGGFWLGGWAISSVVDSVTGDFTNLYGAKAASGNDGSANYAVGQQNATVWKSSDDNFSGFYITNSTYAYEVMENGNMFSKKFGGDEGDDPDFFKLTIYPYNNGIVLDQDSVEFYLADYRFEDNSQDYIVDTWEFIDVSGTSLNAADTIAFVLSSSDVGDNGINTPLFFCIDDIELEMAVNTEEIQKEAQNIQLSPNPVSDVLTVNLENLNGGMLQLMDKQGRILQTLSVQTTQVSLDVAPYPSGLYFLRWTDGEQLITNKFIKK